MKNDTNKTAIRAISSVVIQGLEGPTCLSRELTGLKVTAEATFEQIYVVWQQVKRLLTERAEIFLVKEQTSPSRNGLVSIQPLMFISWNNGRKFRSLLLLPQPQLFSQTRFLLISC